MDYTFSPCEGRHGFSMYSWFGLLSSRTVYVDIVIIIILGCTIDTKIMLDELEILIYLFSRHDDINDGHIDFFINNFF